MIADDRRSLFTVAGVLLIDSPFHVPQATLPRLVEADMGDLPELVRICFSYCDDYLDTWLLPSFSGPTKGGKLLTAWAGGRSHNIAPNQVLHLTLDGNWSTRQIETYKHDNDAEAPAGKVIEPPPGVMLRGVNKSTPPPDSEYGCTIDQFRDLPLLGWEGTYADFIKATIDIDSAHFDMFEKSNDKRVSVEAGVVRTILCIAGRHILTIVSVPSLSTSRTESTRHSASWTP